MMKLFKITSVVFTIFTSLFISFTHQKTNDPVIGKKFPIIESESLAGSKVSLPKNIEGKIALITVAFFEEGQPFINSWAEPFLTEYFPKEDFEYYEAPMINGMPEASKNFINAGMMAGIETRMHPNVVTFYGDYSSYLKILNMDNLKTGYAFLVNRNGIILYKGEGTMSDKNFEEIKRIIEEER